jgi:hypothetical protein
MMNALLVESRFNDCHLLGEGLLHGAIFSISLDLADGGHGRGLHADAQAEAGRNCGGPAAAQV